MTGDGGAASGEDGGDGRDGDGDRGRGRDGDDGEGAGDGRRGGAGPAGRVLVVDANNVVGAAADGWWRDRPAAVRRLLARLQCHVERTGEAVVLVLDVPQADLPEGDHGGVEVVTARRRGRDAADERIVALLDERHLPGALVVTSDRALAADARRRGAEVLGAGRFLARLAEDGC